MSKSVELLRQYLETEYIHNEEMDSPDMSSAIRDLLTDLIHICNEEEVEIGTRVQDALEVYYEEAGRQPCEPESTPLVALLNDDDAVIHIAGVAIEGVGIYSVTDGECGVAQSTPYDGGFDEDGMAWGNCCEDTLNIVLKDGKVSKYEVGVIYPEVLLDNTTVS